MYMRKKKIKQLGHAALYLQCVVTEIEYSIIREAHDNCVCNHDPNDNSITPDVIDYHELILHLAEKYNVLTDIDIILNYNTRKSNDGERETQETKILLALDEDLKKQF